MKVGILQFFSWSRRIPLETVYARALERIEIMDQSGYDAVWFAEHHFTTYSVCPSINVMAMHAADRTKHMRIGTGVTLAGFYHPLRLAEDLAMLDLLSGGRLNWGAGRGFDPGEFKNFKVPVEESSDRFRECVDIVLKAWTNERFSHQGQYWDFEDVEVLPKPLQQPTPPVWLAATSPDSIRRAAERGFNILQDPHASHAEIGNKRQFYYEQLRAHGFPTEGREIPTARLLAVAKTAEEAREIARNGAQWTVGSYAGGIRRDKAPGVDRTPDEDPIERYVNNVIVHGTPEMVTDKLIELRETIGLDSLLGAPLSHESFLLFTEKVLPRLK